MQKIKIYFSLLKKLKITASALLCKFVIRISAGKVETSTFCHDQVRGDDLHILDHLPPAAVPQPLQDSLVAASLLQQPVYGMLRFFLLSKF